MKWINKDIVLNGARIRLLPMEASHLQALYDLSKERKIWEHIPVDMSDFASVSDSVNAALLEKEKGTQYPFVIFHEQQRRIIGSTRLMDMQPAHRKLEIGWTWLHTDFWSSGLNKECKVLLLTFCFEQLHAIRVYLKTDEQNIRSRKAIEKIGGRFEGIFKNDMIRSNGTRRNSAYFSIIEEEWEKVKTMLASRPDQHQGMSAQT